jgi:hypothetical protein
MNRLFAAFVATAIPLLLAPDAQACSLASQPFHDLDDDEIGVDVSEPMAPAPMDTEITISRGVGPRPIGFSFSSTGCDNLGFLTVQLVPGEDDRTPLDEMGFRAEFVSGTLPDGLEFPEETSEAFRLHGDGRWQIVWSDGAEDVQEAFDFTLELFSVDLAGNESAEGLIVNFADPGDDGSGCSMASSAPTPTLALLLLGLIPRRRGDYRTAK